jgi:hypothetical protein
MAATMTLDQFVLNSYLISTGKVTPPVFGATKYTKLTALANLYTLDWSSEPDVDWASQRSVFSLGNVIATDTFMLDDSIGYISRQEGDFVRIVSADGKNEYPYTVVPGPRLYGDGPQLNSSGMGGRNNWGTCAVVGTNLVFDRVFKTTDPMYGGSISVSGYVIPDTLARQADIISVDNPLWLVMRCAAEYIRNDVTRVQLYQSLIDQTNAQMAVMKANNMSQKETIYTGSWNPMPAGTTTDYQWS